MLVSTILEQIPIDINEKFVDAAQFSCPGDDSGSFYMYLHLAVFFFFFFFSLHLYSCAKLSRKENPQKLTQLSSRSHPRHLVGKRTAQKDTIIDITSDSQVNSNFPYRWSPASVTFNNYFYLFLYLYIT